jgi:glycosyltransferase involved in cell wall biosynthesis
VNREERRAVAKQQKKKSSSLPKRILWVSNAPWASTGYGQQSAQVISRLKKAGHEVAIAVNYGLEANSTYWDSGHGQVKVYPRGNEQWSNDVIPAHMYDWHIQEPDADHLLITLFDVWVFKGPKWKDWNVASWTPIDHMPVPPDVAKWSKQEFVSPIAMSQYGQQMFSAMNIDSIYIPHAIEKVFQPTPKVKIGNELLSARELMSIDKDKFVVGMNAANKGVMPNRKAFGENLLAFSLFAKDKDDVILYLHTDPTGSLGGINLFKLIEAAGISKDKVMFADPYSLRNGVEQEILAAIYSGMNVLLATSYGEGFGIPTIEAQACGVPVIASNFAASAELIGDGWAINGQPLWDAPQGAWFNVPAVPEIVEALEEAYNRERKPSEKAVEFASQYDADKVFKEAWEPAIERLTSKERLSTLLKGVNASNPS